MAWDTHHPGPHPAPTHAGRPPVVTPPRAQGQLWERLREWPYRPGHRGRQGSDFPGAWTRARTARPRGPSTHTQAVWLEQRPRGGLYAWATFIPALRQGGGQTCHTEHSFHFRRPSGEARGHRPCPGPPPCTPHPSTQDALEPKQANVHQQQARHGEFKQPESHPGFPF